MKDSFRINQML